MDSFSKVEQSDRKFNITFSVIVSIVVSIAIIGVITYLGFFTVLYSWVMYGVLILAPVFVYALAYAQSSEYEMAYYKKWIDKILGVMDRRKILNDFMQKYKIRNLKTKVDDIKADGRWHFKVSTAHVRSLITKRSEVLLHLEEDRIHAEARLDEEITRLQNELTNEESEKKQIELEEQILRAHLKDAKTAKEIFMQRRDYETIQKRLSDSIVRVNDATYRVTIAKTQKDEAIKSFENSVKKTNDYYYLRYQNYTRSAVKTINMINGLKYRIDDMVEDKK